MVHTLASIELASNVATVAAIDRRSYRTKVRCVGPRSDMRMLERRYASPRAAAFITAGARIARELNGIEAMP